MRVWSPADVEPGAPLRMLLANDGPEYDALSQLTRFCAAKIASGELPPHRVALLAPGDRNQWYSASAAYARVLAHDIVPALRDAFGIVGAPAAMGASLGGLAMLHAQRRFPRALGALFLQSGSFFMPRHDSQERGFARYARIVRFVRETLRDGQYAMPGPVTITCGRAEENAHNNREMARALAAQGYDVSLEEVPDLHNYTGWRDAFDPHLTALLETGVDAMNANHHELYSPAIGAAGTVAVLRALRAAGARVPGRGRPAYDWQDNGMIGAIGDLLDAGRVKLYCVDSFDSQSWSNQSIPLEQRAQRARPLRVVDPRRGGAVHPPRHGRRDHDRGDQPRRVPRRQLRAQARGPLPAGDLPVGQLRPVGAGTAGASAASRPTSTTRSTTSSTSAATTSTGCARG